MEISKRNNRVTSAFNAIVKTLNDAGKLDAFTVDACLETVGIDTNPNDPVNVLVSLFVAEHVVGVFTANNVFTPPLVEAVEQMGGHDKVCAFGFDLGPAQQEGIAAEPYRARQQPFLQGFWPVMQLYLQIDRGISAANLDTRAQLVTQGHRRQRRQTLRELIPLKRPQRVREGLGSPVLRRQRSTEENQSRPTRRHRWSCAPPQLIGGWGGGARLALLVLLYLGVPSSIPGSSARPRRCRRCCATARGSTSGAGMTFGIVNKDLDLSVGSTYGLVAVVFARLFAPNFLDLGVVTLNRFAAPRGGILLPQRRAGDHPRRCPRLSRPATMLHRPRLRARAHARAGDLLFRGKAKEYRPSSIWARRTSSASTTRSWSLPLLR